MHLAKRLEYESNLFTTRHEYEDLGLEMGFDETPENIKFFVEWADDVVLFKGCGCGGRACADIFWGFKAEPCEVIYRLGLSCREQECLPRFGKV